MTELYPNNVEVNIKVTVRHAVTHAAHLRPWYFRVRGRELLVLINDARGCLADRDEIEDNSLLGAAVLQEVFLSDARDILACKSRGFRHMREVVGESQARFVFRHTGTASLSTRSRKR